MADQSVVDFIDNLLKEEEEDHYPAVNVMDALSSTLQNHRIGIDGCRRIVYVTADIHSQDMKTTNNDANPTRYETKLDREHGYACDEPGLIVPAEFGGSWESNNIYRQSKLMDTTMLDADKKEVREHLTGNNPTRYAQLIFAFKHTVDADKFYRPFWVYYRFLLYENNVVVKEFANKLKNVVEY